jgi:protein-disulfide isomerase
MSGSRRKKTARSGGQRRRPRISWVIAAMAAGLAVAGALIGLTRLDDEDSPGATDEAAVAAGHVCTSGGVPVDGATCGHDSAPLTIVEYSEFLCPFCARAALTTVRQIEEEYVAAGKARLEFNHFIVHGEEALLAAGAAECAGRQDAFWEYHDKLFLNQGSVDFSVGNLKQFADELELDLDLFNSCLDSERYVDKLAADIDEARQRGVSATPTFFVGETKVVGAKPYSEFKTAIEDELARLGETGEGQ